MFDGQQLGEDIVGLVRSFMEREIAPLRAENAELKERLKALEEKPAPEMPATPSLDALWSEIRPDAEQIIAEAVSRGVEALPKPKDGDPGKDAANIVEAVKHEGELVLTLQDGRLIRTGIRDGEKGADGRDGFEIDDYDEWFEDDGRILVRQFVRGEDCKEFRHQTALPIDRGVFKAGETYQQGDAVSWGGSLWIAQKETSAKPDTADSGWRLACKKGRDGKDAKNG